MNFPFICVDNFYEDPDEIVAYAKTKKYFSDPIGQWPGKRWDSKDKENNLTFFSWVGRKILSCYFGQQACKINFGGNNSFQLIMPSEKAAHRLSPNEQSSKGWIHSDGDSILGAVVYLNKNQDNNNGTSMYRRKKLGCLAINGDTKRKFYTNKISVEEHKRGLKENNEQFEETLRVSSVYNRLICYDGQQFHAQNFSPLDEDRLTQVIFIKVLNAPPPLPERFRQTG